MIGYANWSHSGAEDRTVYFNGRYYVIARVRGIRNPRAAMLWSNHNGSRVGPFIMSPDERFGE